MREFFLINLRWLWLVNSPASESYFSDRFDPNDVWCHTRLHRWACYCAQKLGKYLKKLSSFPPQKKIGETAVYHIWRYPKFFLILSCVYFNVVHVKNDTQTLVKQMVSLVSNVHHTVSSQQASQCWLLALDVLSHRHDGMKNWLPAFVQKKIFMKACQSSCEKSR